MIKWSLLLLLLYPSLLLAEGSVRFVTFKIPGMVIDEERGRFVLLAREMSKRAGLDMTLQIYPTKRSMLYFQAGEADVLFPAVEEKFPPQFHYERTEEPIFTKHNYIFTRKDKPQLRNYQELLGLFVGVTQGFSYSKELTAYSSSLDEHRIRLTVSDSDEINAKLLIARRIDAFLAEEQSGIKAFTNMGVLDKVHYDKQAPIGIQEVFFAVSGQSSVAGLAKRLSDALVEIKQDGTFGAIMSRR